MKLNKKIIAACVSLFILGMYMPAGTVKRVIELGCAAILVICLTVEFISNRIAARRSKTAA